MSRQVAAVVLLTALWVALWEDVSPANVVGGLLVAGAAVLLIPLRPEGAWNRVRPLAAIRLLLYFHWKLVEASALLAWEVVTPRNRINEAIVIIPLQPAPDFLITLVANMITLTPGTVTIDVDRTGPSLYVHMLHLRSLEEARREVLTLERLAIAAVGPYRMTQESAT